MSLPRASKSQKQTEQFDIRRGEIIDATAKLFAQRGYSATAVSDIESAVNLARGALYYYMGSKESMLHEIHNRVMDPLLAQSSAIVSIDGHVCARVRLISEALLRQIMEHHDHVWVFLHEYRALTGEHLASFRRRRREFEDYIESLFEEGREKGVLKIKDVRLTTLAFLNIHNYTYQWVLAEGRLNASELSAFYCDIFFHGIDNDAIDNREIDADVIRLRSQLTITQT
jgi:TetR/AcrR family transcriptional regulator, cholesterol catabolism regulator